jgi:hypothetical protein
MTNQHDLAYIINCPTLRAYLQRIGARVRSFRSYVVETRDDHAYRGWRTVATLSLTAEGKVKASDPDFAPDEAEAAAIAQEVAAAKFPNSVPVGIGGIELLKQEYLVGIPSKDIFIFKSEDGAQVLFVQQRTYRETGEKAGDLPWSFWSDGAWRMMEPDGKLPLYGLDQLRKGLHHMIHEGAAGAMKVGGLVGEALANHPWHEALKNHTHLGWPGGTDRVNDVDWVPIKKLGPEHHLVFIADHDQKGEEAMTIISRILKLPMDVIMFDDRFPKTFDLADPWPTYSDWWRNKRYVGPTFDLLRTSATWATTDITEKKVEADEDQGRTRGRPPKPVFRIRNQFAAEWVYVRNIAAFANRRKPDQLLSPEKFDFAVKPFSDVSKTSALLVNRISSHVESVLYRPGENTGSTIYDEKDKSRKKIVIFQPTMIQPVKGDIAPFLEFMKHLIPDEDDRYEVLRWCATLIALPGRRILYALLLCSKKQGVGKGTLGEGILAPLVGRHNSSFPSESEVVNLNFNEWQVNKRLAVVHEIYSGQSWKAYHLLKSAISDHELSAKIKFISSYTDENWIHICACSNSDRPLMMEDDDRRWLMPRVTEIAKTYEGFFRDFYLWLRSDGLGIIYDWALSFEKIEKKDGGGKYIQTGERAPMTTVKRRLIAASRSHAQQVTIDFGRMAAYANNLDAEDLANGRRNQKIVLLVSEVHEHIAHLINVRHTDHRFDKPLAIKKALLESGLYDLPRTKPDGAAQVDPRFYVKGVNSFAVANFVPDEPVHSWGQIESFHLRPDQVPVF